MANRPLTFNDYIGQERIKAQLEVMIAASLRMGRALPHIAFGGNAGLGKTTLAQIVANALGTNFHTAMGSNLKSADDVYALLEQVDEGDVVFIDEIHRMPIAIEELFYPVMEDFEVEIVNEYSQLERVSVPHFTLIGATTLAGQLSKPLRDRFGRVFELQNYDENDLVIILQKLAAREEVEYDLEALRDIARRARGVARIGISYFDRCREYAVVYCGGKVTEEAVQEQFAMMGIDELGLTENDHRVLEFLSRQSRPKGVAALCTGVGIDKPTYENVIEPYLYQIEFIDRASNGRVITPKGMRWIGASARVESSTVARSSNLRSLRELRGE